MIGERLSLAHNGVLRTQSARAAYNPHFSATQRFTIRPDDVDPFVSHHGACD
jgi:hypothetical protein